MYQKSGTSDRLELMTFVLQCKDFEDWITVDYTIGFAIFE